MSRVIIRNAGNNQIIAEAPLDTIIELESTYYLPSENVKLDGMEITERTDVCPYKGISNQIDWVDDGVRVENIAWVYQNTKPEFDHIKDKIGFYARSLRGTIVQVIDEN